MAGDAANAHLWDELGKIDYLLNELARGVERGVVPYATYQALAPAKLSRREQIVSQLEGRATSPLPGYRLSTEPLTESEPAHAPTLDDAWMDALEPAGDLAEFGYGVPLATAETASTPVSSPSMSQTRPVAWTTVLLLLGAFLVIVASAIFAIAVWDWLEPGGKLVFLGAVTAGFYTAGWWAREKIDLASGGVVLTAVASALLLFDGWIVIDGYNLQGPLPWATVLLVCSVVYWITEVRLSSGFFGVTGAAAQVGWWWLLGEGLGMPAPTRLAGLALVALAWVATSRRAEGAAPFRSLATVLSWAGVVLAAGSALGIALDLMSVGSASASQVLAAAVVAVAGGAAIQLAPQVPDDSRRLASVLPHVPLLISLAVASLPSNPGATSEALWLLAAFAVAAAGYLSAAYAFYGLPMAILGAASGFGLLLAILRLIDASSDVGTVAMAGLGAVWLVASRLIAGRGEVTARGAVTETAWVAEGAGGLALFGASAWVAAASTISGSASDAWTAAALMVAWVIAAAVRTRQWSLFAMMAWSLYAVPRLVDSAWPFTSFASLAAVVVGVIAVWLLTSGVLVERLFGRAVTDAFGLIARALLVIAWSIGTFVSFALPQIDGSRGLSGEWAPAALGSIAAAALLADALQSRRRVDLFAPLSAALSVLVGSIAAYAAGAAAVPSDTPLLYPAIVPTLVGCTVALVGAMAALATYTEDDRFTQGLALGGVVGALACAFLSGGPEPVWAAGLALLAATVAIAAPTVSRAFYGLAAVFATFSVWMLLAWTEPAAWTTAVTIALLGFLIAAPSFLPSYRPGGHRELAGTSLAAAGLIAHATLAFAAFGSLGGGTASWIDLGEHGFALALLCGGGLLLAVATFRDLEFGLYMGWAALVFAIAVEFNAMDVGQGEVSTTLGAAYLVGMGYVYVGRDRTRRFPSELDAAAAVVGLGIPLLWSLTAVGMNAAIHVAWVVGLSLAALAVGFLMRSRALFLGGASALAAVALYRSFTALAQYWWVWLGLLGVAMLVIALTWERQRLAITDARERMRLRFEGWR